MIHKDQVRRFSKRPYITHLIRVAGRGATLLTEADTPCLPEFAVTALWLHDTVEDHLDKVSFTMLRGMFDSDVVGTVFDLTNSSKKNYPERSRADKKKADCDRIAQCDRTSKTGELIDRIDNMAELIDDAERYDAAAKFLEIYRPETQLLLSALQGTHPALELELKGLCEQ